MLKNYWHEENCVWKGVLAGLAGGLAATFVMSQFQSLMKKAAQGGNGAKKEEKEPATVKAASAVSEEVFDRELTGREKKAAGPVVHYAMGATSGAVYGAMAEVMPDVTVGAGLPFGAAVWLVADEVAVPALGLSKPPTEHPLSTHASALASHLVYGLTTDVVRRMVRRAL